MKTLKCKSLQVSGLLDVHVPAFGISAKDGDVFPVQDDGVAAQLLTNPNFEEVQPEKPSPKAFTDSSEVAK